MIQWLWRYQVNCFTTTFSDTIQYGWLSLPHMDEDWASLRYKGVVCRIRWATRTSVVMNSFQEVNTSRIIICFHWSHASTLWLRHSMSQNVILTPWWGLTRNRPSRAFAYHATGQELNTCCWYSIPKWNINSFRWLQEK